MSYPDTSILSHVSIGTDSLSQAVAFYDAVLPTLGIRQVVAIDGEAVAYGRMYPEFWLVKPLNDQPASAGNGSHIGFIADGKAAVDAFHAAALSAGGRDNGAPGPRPAYGEPYYGCFIIDLDGHRIEAAFWDQSRAEGISSDPAT